MRKRIRQLKDAMAFLSIIALVAVGTSLSMANRANGNTNRIPRDAIVWIEGEKEQGSGVIVSRQGSNYAVLTNWHVVKADGNYTIKINSNSIPYSRKLRLGNVDLALLFFNSSEQYNYANLADSNELSEGQDVYVPTYIMNYPSSRRETEAQIYSVYSGNLVRIQNPDKDGYALVLDNLNGRATSGSPTFDENGRVIGIYGETDKHPDIPELEFYAIPSNIARNLVNHLGESLNLSVATPSQSQPKTNHSYSGNITPLDIPSGSLLDRPSSRNIEPFNLPQGSLLDRQRGRPIK